MKCLLILAVLLLSSCSPSLDGYEFNIAQDFCEDKGGIDYIDLFMDKRVRCNDGSAEWYRVLVAKGRK